MHRRTWIKGIVGAMAGGSWACARSSFAADGELQLRFNLNMSNPGAVALAAQRVWMYLPVRRSACWTLGGIDFGLPHELQRDALGHSILFVPLDGLTAYARRSAPLMVHLKRTEMMSSPVIQDANEWLDPERYIESDAGEIASQASALRSGTTRETIRNIYDFVASNLEYAGYLLENFGALYALRRRRGDCTEYAGLVVALCRALSIPARMVEGYVTDRSFAPKPMDFHDWAEVVVDGRWRVVDAQKGSFLERDEQYIPLRYYRDRALNGVGLAHRYRVEGEMEFSV
ncbi:transglutaminase-like domain-containing protein [Variovorax sp. W6]|uniref:transglutaminase-like domain-containing protein n=1 Tax=Variovorax sp. W6 TaxID=3093895 RepID=UPI003D808DF3